MSIFTPILSSLGNDRRSPEQLKAMIFTYESDFRRPLKCRMMDTEIVEGALLILARRCEVMKD